MKGKLYCYTCDRPSLPCLLSCPRCGSVAFYWSTKNPQPYESPEPPVELAEAPVHARRRGANWRSDPRRPRSRPAE